MNPTTAKLLRACRAASEYRGPGFRWECGIASSASQAEYPNHPFKPGHIRGQDWTPEDDSASRGWGGDRASWAFALENARIGHCIDFYVYSTRDGHLVTNVGIKLVDQHHALMCDTGENPTTVSLNANTPLPS